MDSDSMTEKLLKTVFCIRSVPRLYGEVVVPKVVNPYFVEYLFIQKVFPKYVVSTLITDYYLI
jgi:hypothetical protein